MTARRLFTLASGRTYWQLQSGYFQVTAAPDIRPDGLTGYGRLESIMRLKGDMPASGLIVYADLDVIGGDA